MESMEGKFERYRFDLVVICTNGHTAFRLWEKLSKYFLKNKDVFQLSPTFFAFFRDSLLVSAICHLIILFDPYYKRYDTLTIQKYLNFTNQNPQIFKKSSPKEIKEAVKSDISNLSQKNDILNNLTKWRDKRLFHLDKKYIGDLNQVFRKYKLTFGQIKDLYLFAKDILNRYSFFFDGSTNLMEYGMIDTEFDNLIHQLTSGRTDQIVEKLRALSRLM